MVSFRNKEQLLSHFRVKIADEYKRERSVFETVHNDALDRSVVVLERLLYGDKGRGGVM